MNEKLYGLVTRSIPVQVQESFSRDTEQANTCNENTKGSVGIPTSVVSGNISGNISTEINNRFPEIFPRGNF